MGVGVFEVDREFESVRVEPARVVDAGVLLDDDVDWFEGLGEVLGEDEFEHVVGLCERGKGGLVCWYVDIAIIYSGVTCSLRLNFLCRYL